MKEIKRVAFLVPSLAPGGAERVIVTLANKFSNDFEVHLIVLYKSEIFYTLNKQVRIYFLKDEYTPSSSFGTAIKSNLTYLKKIIRIGRNHNIDVLIGFTTVVNILTVISSLFLRKKCLISERNNPEVFIPNIFWRSLRNFLYPFTNFLIVQTELISNYYKKKIPSDKVKIIPNPINEIIISKRRNYELRENIILSVGRLDENKNQSLLINAFSNLNIDNWELIIVGDGVLKEKYENLVKSLEIEHKVLFTGNVTDVETYYNKAKIFVFTSRSEGFPNALLEAMSFGLPCISTDCPSGPSEIIESGQNGYLVEIDNEKELRARLYELINNPIVCSQFSENAIKSTKKFKVLEVYRQWVNLIIN